MFLPITAEEVKERGWDEVDFVYVTGDAYVDHPSFGAAIITRVMEAEGYRVAVLAQPDWRKNDDFLRFGRPKLGFMVSSGNIDSMVNHYTVNKKRRSEDMYSVGDLLARTSLTVDDVFSYTVPIQGKSNIGVMGYRENENSHTYPAYTREKVTAFFDILVSHTDYVIVDCMCDPE